MLFAKIELYRGTREGESERENEKRIEKRVFCLIF